MVAYWALQDEGTMTMRQFERVAHDTYATILVLLGAACFPSSKGLTKAIIRVAAHMIEHGSLSMEQRPLAWKIVADAVRAKTGLNIGGYPG